MRKILFVPNFLFCLTFFSCQGTVNYPVDFVDRSEVFAFEQRANPLLLVIEINDDGRLSLNKIEIGTIDNISPLTEKLEAIFDDRKKTGFLEKEVVIDPQGQVKEKDLERLIEFLAKVKAAPIRVIRN